MSISITDIVIHCAATQNGVPLAKNGASAAQRIDLWHKKRGFHRGVMNRRHLNPHLESIGYHFVIDVDGKVETGRAIGEIGAHIKGHNQHTIGICLVGGVTIDGKNFGRYTKAQWQSLYELITELLNNFPRADVCGHRDFSPDLNGDGKITPNEFIKDCPCFDVDEWLASEQVIFESHLFKD